MNKNNNLPILGYDELKKLRTALAIAQGTKLLLTLQHETEATVSHDQTQRVTYLTVLFSRIHREMFHDWKEQASVDHRPGTMNDPNKRQQFRKAVGQLVLNGNGDGNEKTAIFDNNGFVMKTDDIAVRLAKFYQTMRSIRPFSYGNRITLDFFMTVLGKLPAFKGVYDQGIDFRRLDARDAVILHDSHSSLEQIITAFEHALNPIRNKGLHNKPNGYGRWPEEKTFIWGIPFLSYTTTDGVKCLVSVNGGLVPLNNVEEDLFMAGKHLADYPRCATENVIGYLPDTEALRQPDKTEIDGIAINNGAAPLFCLDINMLTGLRSPSHSELLELLKQCAGDNVSLFDLANNLKLKEKLLLAAEDDPRLKRSVEIAYDRLGKISAVLDKQQEAIFAGKIAVPNPQLFMSMGGAGAGKTAVEEIAQARCGENFVIASLDEFRKKSDLYRVLTAANHHSDDYVYVEPFANRLRDRVAKKAEQSGINILYDGTSIPYQPRYSTIITQFKAAGFHTQIIAVDAFIVKPQGREEKLSRTCVINSVKARFEKTGRALPWVVTVYKHIRAPESFLNALEHEALDKICLFANDGERDKHYLVAESFDFSEQQVRILQQQQMANTLADYLARLMKGHHDSVLKSVAGADKAQLEGLMARNATFAESNVAYQIYPGKNGNRVLVIYNTHRMIDFIEKRQLNPNASGEEGLLHKPDVLAFDVDPLTKEPWLIRLQS